MWLILGSALLLVAACGPRSTQPESTQKSLPKRAIDRTESFAGLIELARGYATFVADKNKAPKNLDELKAYGALTPKAEKGIQEGKYVVIWNVNTMDSRVVIAYEKEGGDDGNPYVATADGAVNKMTPEQLQAALANK
jgi:hypothetical protein